MYVCTITPLCWNVTVLPRYLGVSHDHLRAFLKTVSTIYNINSKLSTGSMLYFAPFGGVES